VWRRPGWPCEEIFNWQDTKPMQGGYELLHGSRTGDPIGSFWKGTGSSDQESQEVFS
jgi:hypothetical protein